MLKFGNLDSLGKKIVVKSDQIWTVASFNGEWYEKDKNFPEFNPDKIALKHVREIEDKIVIIIQEDGKEKLIEYNGYSINPLIENANSIREFKPGIYFYHGHDKDGIYVVQQKENLNLEKLFREVIGNFPIHNIEYSTIDGMNDDLEIVIQLGNEDILHAVVSLRSESMLKFYPFVYSEQQQKKINLALTPTLLSKYEFCSKLLNQNDIKTLMEKCQESLQKKVDSNQQAKLFVKRSLMTFGQE